MTIVNAIWYNQGKGSNHIELWDFLDVVDQDGIPSLLNCDHWESMLPLLHLQIYYLNEIKLLLLSQVRSIPTTPPFLSTCNY